MIELIMYFILILFAIAEIGVTASLIDHFTRTGFPTLRYRQIVNFLLFTACWTTFFGFIYMALAATRALKRGSARMGTSLSFLSITFVFWLVGAILYTVRSGRGVEMCWGLPALDICRETQAAQALAWTAWAFTILTMLASLGDNFGKDRPSAPTTTTVSVSIVNRRLALNSSIAQRAP